MSIFGTIMNKIFHHGSAPAAQSAPQASTQPQAGGDTATVTAPRRLRRLLHHRTSMSAPY